MKKAFLAMAGTCSVLALGSAAYAQPNNEASSGAPTTAAASAGTVSTAPGAGTPAADGIADIVVVARRTEESQQRTPIAVTALSTATLNKLTVTRIQDIQVAVPSLRFGSDTSQGEIAAIPIVRGVYPPDLADPSVVTYFDDAPVEGRSIGYQLYDLASVQVLKGPQGTLFGRNANQGAVLFLPQHPTDKFEGFVDGRYGNFDDRELTGAINVPVSDTFAVRASGDIERRHGWLKGPGQDYADRHHESIRLQADFKPSSSFSNHLLVSYEQIDEHPNLYTLSGLAPCPSLSPVCAYEPPVGGPNGAYFQDIDIKQELATELANGKNHSDSAVDFPQFAHYKFWNVTDAAQLQLSDSISLKNIAHYDHANAHSSQNFDGSNSHILDILYHLGSENYSDEVQLRGKSFSDKFNWVVGAFYSHSTGINDPIRLLFTEITPPDVNGVPVNPDYQTNRFGGNSKALFAQGTYSLSSLLEGLSLTAGYRYTWDKRHERQTDINNDGACGYTVYEPSPNIDAASCTLHVADKYKKGTYNLSLSWQLTPKTLIYGTVNSGYKAGNFNLFTNDPTVIGYQPEYVTNYETGLKTDFKLGKVPFRFNAAGFIENYKDYQYTSLVVNTVNGVPNTEATVVNRDNFTGIGNKVQVKGFEIEATTIPIPGLTLSGFFSRTTGKYKRLIRTSVVGGVATPVDFSGTPLPVQPRTAGGTIDISPPSLAGTWGTPTFTTNIFYKSRLRADPFANYLAFDEYTQVDMRLEVANIAGKGLDLSVYGKNITGGRHLTASRQFTGGLGYILVSYSEPTTYGVELRYRF